MSRASRRQQNTDIHVLKISAGELKAMRDIDAAFIVAIEIAFNDIQMNLMLQLLTLNTHAQTHDIEIASDYAVGRTLIVMRNLTSRVYEFIRLIKGQIAVIERGNSDFSIEAFSEIKNFIAQLERHEFFTVMETLRNNVTHHYVPQKMKSALTRFSDEQSFSIYSHETDGNSFSAIAEQIAFLGVTGLTTSSRLDEYQSWLSDTLHTCVMFRHDFLAAVMIERFPEKRPVKKVVSLPRRLVRNAREATLPMFLFQNE